MQGCPKSSCRNLLDSNDTPDDISLEKLLEKAEIDMMVYLQALSICSAGNSIVMKRKPSQSWTNAYNPDLV